MRHFGSALESQCHQGPSKHRRRFAHHFLDRLRGVDLVKAEDLLNQKGIKANTDGDGTCVYIYMTYICI